MCLNRVGERGSSFDAAPVRDERGRQRMGLGAGGGSERVESPGREERIGIDNCAEASTGEALARHDPRDAHRRELAEDEERDAVADSRLKSSRELVVDDHLTGPRRGIRQAGTGPAEGCRLFEVEVPHERDRLGPRHAIAREGR